MKCNSTYKDDVNHCLQDPTTLKVVDASCVCRGSTAEILTGENNVYYISEARKECEKYNVNVGSDWKKYDGNLIPCCVNGCITEFEENNPYSLKYLWLTDGSYFLSFGKITFSEPNKNYQSSSWSIEDMKNNPHIVNCDSFDSSPFKNEIIAISRYAKADIGAVGCTNSNNYVMCLRGPAERIADFKEWLISITNSHSLIFTEDKNLAVSIRISGGLVKSLHKNECDDNLKRLFDIDGLRKLEKKVLCKDNKIA